MIEQLDQCAEFIVRMPAPVYRPLYLSGYVGNVGLIFILQAEIKIHMMVPPIPRSSLLHT